ncbi:MAG: hypothetical protein RLP14_08270 [Owenweeksia sp.]
MKKLPILLCLILLLSSCSTDSADLVYTTLLLDITRDSIPFEQPDTATTTDWLLPEASTSGVLFEIGYITDLHQNRMERGELPTSSMLTNELQRKAERRRFLHQAMAITQHAWTTKGGREQSIVLRQVAHSINRQVSCRECTSGVVYVLSDFMEHSYYLSFYDDAPLNFFEHQPDSLYTLLDTEFPIPGLEGKSITLAMIHQPVNREDDQRFHRITALLLPYYQSKGITAEVFSSLQQAINYSPVP